MQNCVDNAKTINILQHTRKLRNNWSFFIFTILFLCNTILNFIVRSKIYLFYCVIKMAGYNEKAQFLICVLRKHSSFTYCSETAVWHITTRMLSDCTAFSLLVQSSLILKVTHVTSATAVWLSQVSQTGQVG